MEIRKACITDLISKTQIATKIIKYLRFNGENKVIFPKGGEIYSDTIMYPLKPIPDIAISIYFGSVPKKISGHYYSRTASYIEEGNKIIYRIFSEKNKIIIWVFYKSLRIIFRKPKKDSYILRRFNH